MSRTRFIMLLQLAFFFTVGAMAVQARVREARAEAVSGVLIQLPIEALGEIKVDT